VTGVAARPLFRVPEWIELKTYDNYTMPVIADADGFDADVFTAWEVTGFAIGAFSGSQVKKLCVILCFRLCTDSKTGMW
jgi:hypothetical protein